MHRVYVISGRAASVTRVSPKKVSYTETVPLWCRYMRQPTIPIPYIYERQPTFLRTLLHSLISPVPGDFTGTILVEGQSALSRVTGPNLPISQPASSSAKEAKHTKNCGLIRASGPQSSERNTDRSVLACLDPFQKSTVQKRTA